ncbi:hypothetical protein [Burkholderia paludis]|uniref:hypothetical protein n=1 Tax=Burkholderia paludis TaxID=1506587 RepID=UPI00126987E2|nr:hypothetical protein [Burkholderia paludis]
MRAWADVEKDANQILDYLKKSIFFEGPCKGEVVGRKIIFDASLAAEYSTDDSGDKFSDWQGILESITPAWPDMSRSIESKILSVLDQIHGKNYSGVSEYPLIQNMEGDVSRLLHCYAYGEVHPLWRQIEQIYLDGGIPCGWEGNYPNGELVVFSNHPIP